jgi:predicted metalloprotease
MDVEGRRRSSNFEDRGRSAGGGGGGVPVQALFSIVRLLGFKGSLIVAALAAVGFFVLPAGLKRQLLGALGGGSRGGGSAASGGSACQASPSNNKACDFSRAILASTEDVWTDVFKTGALPNYGVTPPTAYPDPTLVVFSDAVSTGGCGNATSDVGPFYCPGDKKLYIDPSFYDVMAKQLHAPGDFAQAYVIAHEIGHHVQNLFGANRLRPDGETKNQISVRMELQADCLAGVWGHSARASLKIDDADLKEATNAAHNIGDDALGHQSERDYTHGSSAQRMRWFKRGFDSGDARQCDTFGVKQHAQL